MQKKQSSILEQQSEIIGLIPDRFSNFTIGQQAFLFWRNDYDAFRTNLLE